jgi:hypothetical protein
MGKTQQDCTVGFNIILKCKLNSSFKLLILIKIFYNYELKILLIKSLKKIKNNNFEFRILIKINT